MAEEKNWIKIINTLLGEYYGKHFKDSQVEDHYFNDKNKRGLFAHFCDENGFEDSSMVYEEFIDDDGNTISVTQFDPDDFLLSDFDKNKNSPFKDKDDVKRKRKIYQLLLYIIENEELPTQTKVVKQQKLKIDLDMNQSEVYKITDNIFMKQLTCLSQLGTNEPGMLFIWV